MKFDGNTEGMHVIIRMDGSCGLRKSIKGLSGVSTIEICHVNLEQKTCISIGTLNLPQNISEVKGIEYLKKSADIGVYPDAAYELGRIFKDGDGAYKNIDLAEEYYERAADIDYSFTKPEIILKTKNADLKK